MQTAVSAPGKVLLAGGYLVLDRAYTGLVFGLSARIHVVVHDADPASTNIVVQSPQFRDAEWIYSYRHVGVGGRGVELAQVQGASSTPISPNPFVETALSYALTYITSTTKSAFIKPSLITILADNDYYSQPSKGPSSASNSPSQFSDFGVRLQDAHKTGLGSSAALVTAFTAAVLSHCLPPSLFSIASTEGHARLHNLAQAAHCAAQGKVGSGFDVTAAVYGTCIYRRFSPSVLSGLGEPNTEGFATRLQRIVEDTDPVHKWDTEITKGSVNIPYGMSLVMCDVDCGSQTVGMVKKVLEWRKQDPDGAKALWDQLQAANETLAQRLLTGTSMELREVIGTIRAHIREMGVRSGVPIEPAEQTALLDALTGSIDDVCGVVPGAGGYDAIVLLVKDDEKTLAKIRELVANWSKDQGSNVSLLGVKGEMEGVREEVGKFYGAWIK